MRLRSALSFGCVLLAFLAVGCKRVSVPGLDAPEQMTLYSIDGNDYLPEKRPKTAEQFHRYPVLGKVEITDPNERQELASALKRGITPDDGSRTGCFWPRHGLRVLERGRTFDFVICFQCLHVDVYEAASSDFYPLVTREPLAVFNQYLERAGIPLAPGP